MDDESYINYFSILGLTEDCKTGDVRKNYKKMMKDLIMEIHATEVTPDRLDQYLLNMAKLNVAFYILRDDERRETYIKHRKKVIELEKQWRDAGEKDPNTPEADLLRREFDRVLRDFLTKYMEEMVLEAGRDKECVETSNWDPFHERHASRVLRHYRQKLYSQIHERLPYYDVTKPIIDWTERENIVKQMLQEEKA
ncbi:MAG TPA: hypothetical protein PLT82_08715 [Candidatus Hydrogenedens sp.]|nr:J domain-containing protein [Candidatus Hydrogenedens sp.]HOK09489.1 hypothetical protein [Candidatus Hydrogenedens sp.]HOL20744.1 hypothetical protein [Candidatus Hydrogenedens sp.]HPP59198.1 hypothetical protein [Candidatus Hydrogenedens sp.]